MIIATYGAAIKDQSTARHKLVIKIMAKMQLILGLTILFIAVEVAISSPTGVDHCMYCACHMLNVYNYYCIEFCFISVNQDRKSIAELLAYQVAVADCF